MPDLNIALATVGALILTFSLLADFARSRLWLVSEPMAAVALGVLLGPIGIGALQPSEWGEPRILLEQAARFAVAISVMAAALRLPAGYLQRHAGPLAVALGPLMLLMWIATGLLAWSLLGLPFWMGMLVGAVLTPTDPVLAGTIVTGKMAPACIPARLRHILTGEAGANDGGAYPLVFLCLLMIARPPGEALAAWVVQVLLWDVLAAVALGAAIGWTAGRVQCWSRDREYLEPSSKFTVTVALTITVLAAVKLLGSDGLLAVFAAGVVFNRQVGDLEDREQAQVQETVNRLVAFPLFVLFGIVIPWSAWGDFAPAGITLALTILLLRRLPAMLLIRPVLRPVRSTADALFYGWFGPIGAAALYYAAIASRHLGNEVVWNAATLVVLASVVAHGATSTKLTRVYGSRARRTGSDRLD